MKEELGKLIVSTRSASIARKTYIYVFSAFLLLLDIFWFVEGDGMRDMLRGSFGRDMSTMVYWLVGIVMLGFPIFMVVSSFLGFRSYCDVYENGVVGTTGVSYNQNAAPQQNFQLSYDEIVNATESGKTVFIYTKYATLEVLALKNREKACQEIRARAKGSK